MESRYHAALAERYTAKTGLAAQDNLEDFAVFIARQAAVVLDMAERQLIGGRYKVRATSPKHSQQPRVQVQLGEHCEDGQTRKAVRAEASEYLREMIRFPRDSGSMCGPSSANLPGARVRQIPAI